MNTSLPLDFARRRNKSSPNCVENNSCLNNCYFGEVEAKLVTLDTGIKIDFGCSSTTMERGRKIWHFSPMANLFLIKLLGHALINKWGQRKEIISSYLSHTFLCGREELRYHSASPTFLVYSPRSFLPWSCRENSFTSSHCLLSHRNKKHSFRSLFPDNSC